MIFDALKNAAYRVPLRGQGAELEEGTPPPPPGPTHSAPSTGPARVNPLWVDAWHCLCSLRAVNV